MASENHIFKLSNAGGFKTLTRYPDMLAGNAVWNPWSPQGAYDSLATIVVPSGGLASVTFAGIPQGYKHLQLRILFNTWTTGNGDFAMRFNGDSASNYSRHGIYGNGSAVAYGLANQTFINVGYGVNAGAPSASITDILEYANTAIYKTTRTLEGRDRNSSGDVAFGSGSWRNTAAITSIEFTPPSSVFPQHSSFALYGVK